MAYLRQKSFPAVLPYCAIVERLFLVKRLHLVTYLEEGAVELLDRLRQSSRRERLRWVRRLARMMWLMKEAGVFHPDFHLRNVLVVPGGRLVFLDFDRAKKKCVSDKDMRSMFLRLERFADKMVRQGRLDGDGEEKFFFLKAYGRLSGSISSISWVMVPGEPPFSTASAGSSNRFFTGGQALESPKLFERLREASGRWHG